MAPFRDFAGGSPFLRKLPEDATASRAAHPRLQWILVGRSVALPNLLTLKARRSDDEDDLNS